MAEIELSYGRSAPQRFIYDASRYEVLALASNADGAQPPLSDVLIGAALDAPIGSPPLEEIINPDETVLIVASDATRVTASAQIINLLVRRLIELGIAPPDINIIFATGIHRPVTATEKRELLTPFIAQRIKTLDHDAHDASKLTRLGVTERGTIIEVNSALQEHDHIILTGGIGFHYFAGFTGGRKSICPGLASAATIAATHMLALDFERGARREGVGAGVLDGNAVHEECERIAGMIAPSFLVNTMVDERGRATHIYAGDWRAAHRVACADYAESHSLKISARRETAIVSCGGAPRDLNLIQAHKALETAAQACVEGGTIVLVAECAEGLGRADFLKWFEAEDSRALAERLRTDYEVNGQTAWSLMTKTERFRVYLVSTLADEDVRRMRMIPARTVEEALAQTGASSGYILPEGAALLPVIA